MCLKQRYPPFIRPLGRLLYTFDDQHNNILTCRTNFSIIFRKTTSNLLSFSFSMDGSRGGCLPSANQISQIFSKDHFEIYLRAICTVFLNIDNKDCAQNSIPNLMRASESGREQRKARMGFEAQIFCELGHGNLQACTWDGEPGSHFLLFCDSRE